MIKILNNFIFWYRYRKSRKYCKNNSHYYLKLKGRNFIRRLWKDANKAFIEKENMHNPLNDKDIDGQSMNVYKQDGVQHQDSYLCPFCDEIVLEKYWNKDLGCCLECEDDHDLLRS